MVFVTGTLVLETKTVVSKPETIVLAAETMVFLIKKIFLIEETTVFGIAATVFVKNTVVAISGTTVCVKNTIFPVSGHHGHGCKDYCVGRADHGVQGFIHRIYARQTELRQSPAGCF